MTFVQGWTNVEDVGPTLYKYYTNVCVFLEGYTPGYCEFGRVGDNRGFDCTNMQRARYWPYRVVQKVEISLLFRLRHTLLEIGLCSLNFSYVRTSDNRGFNSAIM